jgi:DNA replication protein DnaC
MTDQTERTPRSLGEILGEQIEQLTARLTRTGAPLVPDHPEYPQPDAGPDAAPCERCRGAGFLRRDVRPGAVEFGQLVECGCGLVAARRLAKLYHAAGIPTRFADATFDSFPVSAATAPVVEVLRSYWLDDPPSWLLLAGPVGRGKTGLAVAALKAEIERGKSGLFVESPSLLDRIRQTFDDVLGVKEHELYAAVRDIEILVIDDLGKEPPTEWVRARLFTLLNDRYNGRRRTIITTNLTSADLVERIGEASVSRIEDACGPQGSYIVRLAGPNLRGEHRSW